MIKSLEKVENIFLVSSGKGGVGKTMVATNLAIALARDGFKTGILDADIYGPSLPITMGVAGERPQVDNNVFTPIESYGVKVMSLGFLMKKEDAVIWRGPMASNALKQLIENTTWGELDYLIVDLPPGTGDISITLAQLLAQAKSIIVVTPQEMAIADGRKAASMFNSNGINIDILGIVENMSWFTPEKHLDEKYFLFGNGGGKKLANDFGVPLLAQIPLVSDVCNLGDMGKTVFNSSNALIGNIFQDLAKCIALNKFKNKEEKALNS